MTNTKQDNDFLAAILPEKNFALEFALDWIGKNMSPSDVFTTQQLQSWAEASGFVPK